MVNLALAVIGFIWDFMVILEFSFETNSEYEFNYKRYPNLIHPQSDSIIIKISK